MTPSPSVRSERASALIGAAILAAALAGLAAPAPAAGQDVLRRTPNLATWVGIPWTLHTALPHRFRDVEPGDGIDLASTTTFTHALGLPWRSLAGVAYAMRSPTVPGEPDEIQPFVRHRLLDDATGPADLAVTAAWNTAAGSLDLDATAARAFGPLRVLAAARWLADARGTGDDRTVVGAGVVWHPLPRSAPLALSADVTVPTDGLNGADPAWSAGVQAGIPFTALTLSLQATNTAATTLQGASFAASATRWGFEFTVPIPAGYFLGRYPPREHATEAVTAAPDAPADLVVEIRRYEYGPVRTVIPAGSTVRWVNRDEVVHTATAEDAAWDSGAIPPGESWSGRFDEPGVYPYLCGPHPFMKGVVIVQ